MSENDKFLNKFTDKVIREIVEKKKKKKKEEELSAKQEE